LQPQCDGNMPRRAQAHTAFQPVDGALYEIEIAEGDIVELADSDCPNGWQAVRLDGIEGIVPATHLKMILDEEDGDDAEGDGRDGSRIFDEEQGHDGYGDEDDDDANKRICLLDFVAEPGQIYELPMKKGDLCELTDEDAPYGWVAAVSLATGNRGLVPESYLGPAPRTNPEGPTQEELEIRKAQEQKAELETELEAAKKRIAEQELMREDAMLAAKAREEELQREIVELKKQDAEREEREQERIREREADKSAVAARLRQIEDEETVWPSTDQRALRTAMREAEQARADAEKNFNALDNQRTEAEQNLADAERRAQAATAKVRAEEHAREANNRALQLLPGLRELLAPTQHELKLAVDAVANAVIKNAEDSAKLLAKLAVTHDPAGALQDAVQRRSGGRRYGSERQWLTELQVPDDDDSVADSLANAPLSLSSRPTPLSLPSRPTPRGAGEHRWPPHPPPGQRTGRTPARSYPGKSDVSNRAAASQWSSAPHVRQRQSLPDRLRTETRQGGDGRLLLPGGDLTTSPLHRQSTDRPKARRPLSARRSGAPPPPPKPPAAIVRDESSGISRALPPETLDSTEDPEILAAAAVEVYADAANEQTTGAKEAAWRAISSVAPAARVPAKQVEKSHRALRRDLRNARHTVTSARLGAIDFEPTRAERVQHRGAHATYGHMMRQRKAREIDMYRREAMSGAFVAR
jgi:hypothetical protein